MEKEVFEYEPLGGGVNASVVENEAISGEVFESGLDAVLSFETFNGRSFFANRPLGSRGVFEVLPSASLSSRQFTGKCDDLQNDNLPHYGSSIFETPLGKLSRLRNEVQQLHGFVAELQKDPEELAKTDLAVLLQDNNDATNLFQELDSLKIQLNTVAQDIQTNLEHKKKSTHTSTAHQLAAHSQTQTLFRKLNNLIQSLRPGGGTNRQTKNEETKNGQKNYEEKKNYEKKNEGEENNENIKKMEGEENNENIKKMEGEDLKKKDEKKNDAKINEEKINEEKINEEIINEEIINEGDKNGEEKKNENFKKLEGEDFENGKVYEESEAGEIIYELYETPSLLPKIEMGKVANLEARLSALERILGCSQLTPFKNILHAIGALRLKLDHFDASHLDAIGPRIKVLLSELQTVQSTRREITTTDDQQVDALYDICERWKLAMDCLPNTLLRLKTLKLLHSKAGGIATRLTVLEAEQSELRESLHSATKNFSQLQHTVGNSLEWILRTTEVLSRRIDQLPPI